MQLKSYLDNNSSFKDEVIKLANEVKEENIPKEFYNHAVKSVVEKYSAYFSRKAGKSVDPDQVSEIADISAAAALRIAFSNEPADGASESQKVSYEEISKTVDEYFDKNSDDFQGSSQELNQDSVYHEIESDSEQPSEVIDGDAPAQDSNINQPRPTAF
jgi:hypothetical protein